MNLSKITSKVKKILLQTVLLIVVFIIALVFTVGFPWEDDNLLFYSGAVDFSILLSFLYLTLFIFLPITVLYFIRKESSKILGKLFRFTAYLTFFILLAFFFTNFLPNTESAFYSFIDYDAEEKLLSESMCNLLFSATYLILAILMYITVRVNKSLSDNQKFSLIPMKENRGLFLVLSSILFVLIISLYLWYKATHWAYLIENGTLWFENTELARMAIRDTYNVAFKKLVLIGGFIFISTFLLLRVMKNKNNKLNSQNEKDIIKK